ncbi:hypothetical protein LX81_03252 [Palleronia aestuarii]|uniref:Uncharacterized protein n=1 Tax=Palleronia aestuarii TaxID=568105 RepID=A0A2W7N568_9RHOB|nr:hypothetical protein [Palleronia aestuarii]PZX13467.1 hypothetical protein LX81_03252 [Palleronia aestuarii]
MNLRARLDGLWDRERIVAGGCLDTSTRVLWMQAPGGFVDLRLPPGRPDIAGCEALCDLGRDDLAHLLSAEGFAGEIAVAGDVCTWHRAINWQGFPVGPDEGRIAFDAEGRLIETGIHADYVEDWRGLPGPVPFHGVWASGDWRLHLAWAGTLFLLGIGRADQPRASVLRAALVAGGRTDEVALAAQFRALYAMGNFGAEGGRVEQATDPFLEGRVLLEGDPASGAPLVTRRCTFLGHELVEEWTPQPSQSAR